MRSRLRLLTALVSFLLLPGCGGGSAPPPPPPVTVSVSASHPTVPAGGTDVLIATVRGSSNHAVTWQVNGVVGGDDTSGRISDFGLYMAPQLIPSPASVTITAIAQADATKTASASVTVTIGVTVSPLSSSLNIEGAQQPFTVTVTGTSNTAVGWSVNGFAGGNNAVGMIAASGLYTSPDAIPIPPTVSVTATSVVDPTQSGSASVDISAGGPVVNQEGQSTPIKLGTSGGNAMDHTSQFCCSGTLGALVTRNGTNYILSNNHVLARSDAASAGEPIDQPGLVDNNCAAATPVANFTQKVKLKGNPGNIAPADAALAQVAKVGGVDQVDAAGAILQLGVVSGGLAQPAPPASTVEAPMIGMFVAKSGRTTGLTCDTITAINVNGVQVQYDNACGSTSTFTVTYNNQVEIDSTTFSDAGDSGSLIVDTQTAQPVALLFAGDPTSTIANPIQAVLAALADPQPPHAQPAFVGGPVHPVSACTGTSASAQKVAEAIRSRPRDEELTRATTAKQKHELNLMKDPAVIGVGVGAGDTPGEAVIVVFVDKEKSHSPIPATLDGVKTRVKSVGRFKAFGGASCPAKHDAPTYPISLH